MLADYFVYPRVVFVSRSTELQRVSVRSGGAEGRKREQQPHAESRLNYLEEPDGVQRLLAHVCQSIIFMCVFFLIHWMLKDTNITLLLLLSTITRKTQLQIIIHDIDWLHTPHRLRMQKISQHFAGRTPLIFHLYQMADPHVQTVTSVLLLVGSPLCLGCMCGEWPYPSGCEKSSGSVSMLNCLLLE